MNIEERRRAGMEAARATGHIVGSDWEGVDAAISAALSGLIVLGEDGKYGTVYAEKGTEAHEGEPVFPLRGRDLNAPTVIGSYADVAQGNGSPLELLTEACTAQQRFREWQAQNIALTHAAD